MVGGAKRFLLLTRAKARGKRKSPVAAEMKPLKKDSDAAREKVDARPLLPRVSGVLFLRLIGIRAFSLDVHTHFLQKCLGNDACVKLSGFVWVGFVHAKVTVLTRVLSSF